MTDIASIRSAMAVELENALRAERSKFQLQLQQLHDEHQQEIAELTSKDRLQNTAEQQVKFNEALKKAIDEKEALVGELEAKNMLQSKQIDQLQSLVTSSLDNSMAENGINGQEGKGKLRGIAEQQVLFNEALNKAISEKNAEMERLSKEVESHKEIVEALNLKLSQKQVNGKGDYNNREISSGVDVEGKLADLTVQNARLETELKETKNLLEKTMSSSVMCIPEGNHQV